MGVNERREVYKNPSNGKYLEMKYLIALAKTLQRVHWHNSLAFINSPLFSFFNYAYVDTSNPVAGLFTQNFFPPYTQCVCVRKPALQCTFSPFFRSHTKNLLLF